MAHVDHGDDVYHPQDQALLRQWSPLCLSSMTEEKYSSRRRKCNPRLFVNPGGWRSSPFQKGHNKVLSLQRDAIMATTYTYRVDGPLMTLSRSPRRNVITLQMIQSIFGTASIHEYKACLLWSLAFRSVS